MFRKEKKTTNAQMTAQSNDENSSATINSTPNSNSSFSYKQLPYLSIARADSHFLESPNRKAEVIQRLADYK